MCHDYSGAPWEPPFGHVDAKQPAPLGDALAGWNLLCDSKHVTACPRTLRARNVTPRCVMAPPTAVPRAAALPARRRRGVRDLISLRAQGTEYPGRHRAEAAMSSSCAWPRRGRTRWCSRILKRFENDVVVEAGAPDVDVFYRRTKVLLVPSIWPEAFGLVATEAAARGIPVLSTDFERPRGGEPRGTTATFHALVL